jgi:hypothetical protein
MANAYESSLASDSYVLSPGNLANGTGFIDEIAITPTRVVRRFGAGNPGDNYKVSRQWAFRKDELVFTLYDWKCTNLYAPDFWTPEELWQSDWPFDLHIGSKEPATEADVQAFAAYLQQETSQQA